MLAYIRAMLGRDSSSGPADHFAGLARRLRRFASAFVAGSLGLTIGASSVQASAPVAEATRAAQAPASELEGSGRQDLGNGSVLRFFHQETGGVPVLGASSIVQVSADGDTALVADSTESRVTAPTKPSVDRRQAVSIARQSVGAQTLRGRPRASLLIDTAGGADSLIWDVKLAAADPVADYRVVIDASNGGVRSSENILRHATGTASIFTPNPVVDQGSWFGLKDRQDRNSATLTSLRGSVPLLRLDEGQSCLKGKWASATVGKEKVCEPGLDFTAVKRKADAFEALMAYHHIDRTQNYLATDLFGGLTFPNFEERGPGDYRQVVRANALAADNSFYSPSTFRIELGTGGVDDGEDADVITHEYGHALQDDAIYLASGGNSSYGEDNSNSAGAMGEGFGDYVAAMMQNEYGTSHASQDEWCIAEWDAVSYDPGPPHCLRQTNNPSTLQAQIQNCSGAGNIHCVGEVWSSALYDLKGQLGTDGGADVMDRVAMLYTYLLPDTDPSWAQAAQAVRVADCVFYPNEVVDANGICDPGESGLHDGAIVAEFNARGF
jgi:hypothetical protein